MNLPHEKASGPLRVARRRVDQRIVDHLIEAEFQAAHHAFLNGYAGADFINDSVHDLVVIALVEGPHHVEIAVGSRVFSR